MAKAPPVPLGARIVEALGFDPNQVEGLSLYFKAGQAPKVIVYMLPQFEEQRLVQVLKEYELVERESHG